WPRDWSSDVCSSDLAWRDGLGSGKLLIAGVGGSLQYARDGVAFVNSALSMAEDALEHGAQALMAYAPTPFRQSNQCEDLTLDYRSEERRVGKEGRSG